MWDRDGGIRTRPPDALRTSGSALRARGRARRTGFSLFFGPSALLRGLVAGSNPASQSRQVSLRCAVSMSRREVVVGTAGFEPATP